MLDKRLTACAGFVKGDFVCDVGTDHAYLVAELLSDGKCRRAIAADINEKPLAAAEATLKKYGVSDRAELVLSDGLRKILLDGVSDIVIAGMGGELISTILGNAPRSLRGINLILQPMTQIPFLRKYLADNGYEINAEKAVCDGTHNYAVINAAYTGEPYACDDVAQQLGRLKLDDENAVTYVRALTDKLLKAGHEMALGGYLSKGAENISLAHRIYMKTGDRLMYNVGDIMALMDKIAPLANLHKGDNSGLLVGTSNKPAKKVLVALDITCEVVKEAAEKGADVIISHHPVIFNPLYSLTDGNPACLALKNDISCLCFHSPLDMADGGINDIIYDMLKKPFGFAKPYAVLEPVQADGRGYGMACCAANEFTPKEMATRLKSVFGCTVVRYTNGFRPIKKIAFCSGGAGSDLPLALKLGADAFITGDVKHDQLITALNEGVSLFDCGHYHTEVIAVNYIVSRFKEAYPDLDISAAQSCADPAEYVI